MEARWFAVAAAGALGFALLVVFLRPAWVTRWPRSVLTAVALLTLASASQVASLEPFAFRLQIDPSTEPLLPAGDPEQALYDSAVVDFGDDEVYVVALECAEVFTRDCLETIERVSAPISRLDGVRSLTSLMDVTSFRFVPENGWIEVRPFIEDIPDTPEALADLRQRALADPVYRRTLVSDESRAAAINITFRRTENDAQLIADDLDGKVRAVLDGEQGRRFYVSGRPHFKTHVYHGMTADLVRLIPLGVLVMAVVLWLCTGSLRGVVLPIVCPMIAILWSQAVMVATGTPLNLLTVLLAPMFLAMGSVYVVHVLARFDEEVRRIGSVREGVEGSLHHLVLPVGMAGLTTSIGFGALLLTDVPAVFELGLLSVFGIGSITLLSLSAVPAALLLLPIPAAAVGRSTRRARMGAAVEALLDRLLTALAEGVRRRSREIIALCAVAGVVAAASLPFIVIDTDYLSYFDEDDPVRVDFEAVNRLLAGAVPLYVVVEGQGAGTFRDPELLRAMWTLQKRLEEVPGVSRTLSFLDSLRKLNRAFEEDDPAQEKIPDTRGGVTELLFMLPKAEMSRYVTINHARANIVLRTGEIGSAALSRLTRDIEAVIEATPLPGGAEATVTGNAKLLARSADGIARGQPRSVGLAAVSIFVLIAFGLRSPKLGAVAMIPNILPVLVFFGLLGMGAAPLSLPTSLIGCVALGIAIDDTVHFLMRYRAERRQGRDPERAALECGRRIGRPIAITSLMLVAGFLVVAFSEFATLREFGVLTAVTMGICLVTDLILLPAVLMRLRI